MTSSHHSRPIPAALERRMPDVRELASLVRFAKPSTDRVGRRLEKATSVWELREIAKRRTPKAPFDYVDGAAEAEISLRRSRLSYRNVEFVPHVLHDVSDADTSTEIFGRRVAMPLGIAPTGFTRMMHSEGEYAGSAAAADADIPFCLSTMGTASIEDVATHAPDGDNWFQLYLWNDREASAALVERAWQAGFRTLVVTVDTAIAGARLRDTRNGFSIPPQLTARTVLDAAAHPHWWFDFLTHEPLSFASLSRSSGTVADLVNRMFDPSLDHDGIAWLAQLWPGRLVVKGVQSVPDAARIAEGGVDGIILSNHGGRQLDRAPIPLHLLPEVRAELGDAFSIGIDTGIMDGADVVAAVALGADYALVGRAYMYGLMAGGQRGVTRMLDLMHTAMRRTMRLVGVNAIDDLTPEHVNLMTPQPARGHWV